MAARLSPRTEEHVATLFRGNARHEASELLLHQCGNNLPSLEKEDEFRLERVRFAALKLSQGEIDKLRKAIELAKTDWRDLLMAAGFGKDLNEHKLWSPDPLTES